DAVGRSVPEPLRHREPVEDPRHTRRDPEAGIARGQADDDAAIDPHRSVRETAAESECRAGVRARRRREVVARLVTAVDLSDDLDTLPDSAGNRESVSQHVSLTIAAGWIAENAEACVADEADRRHGLA